MGFAGFGAGRCAGVTTWLDGGPLGADEGGSKKESWLVRAVVVTARR
jgi:hypothetical protein